MNLNHATNKQTGDPVSATEWNNLASDVNEIGANSSSSSYMYVNDKGNLCIETRVDNIPSGKKGKINIEALDDIQIKPGDDLALYAHHRSEGNKDLLLLKVLTEATDIKNGSDKTVEIPTKLRINSADISFTNKDTIVAIMVEIKTEYNKTVDYKIANDFAQDTFTSGYLYTTALINAKLGSIVATLADGTTAVTAQNLINDILGAGIGKARVIQYTTGAANVYYKFTKVSNADGVINMLFEDSDGFGYLKVRAQAIDLRCEEHGGIAILPKGYDGSNPTPHMNKIKFEHGGGDGLEFGTFNTEHTSLFTEDYRFNKAGVIKLATRTTLLSDKYDGSDETTHYKYIKNQDDDFYDNIDPNDPTCTWEDLLTLVNYFKNGDGVNSGPWASQL